MSDRAAVRPAFAMTLYLASTSPRRRALLSDSGLGHRIVEPGPEPEAAGSPADRALARAVSKAVGALLPADAPVGLVAGVDTVVDVDGVELGKPRDGDDAARMLRRLLGRVHRVHTGVCVRRHPHVAGRVWSGIASSSVRFAPADEARVRAHVASGAWQGKAGGYGIQDADLADLATLVAGDLDTVVGLPLRLLRQLIARASEA